MIRSHYHSVALVVHFWVAGVVCDEKLVYSAAYRGVSYKHWSILPE